MITLPLTCRTPIALMIAGLVVMPALSFAQAPAAAAAAPAPAATPVAPNVIGLPGASNVQNAAVAELEASLTPLTQAVGAARSALTYAVYAQPADPAALSAAAEGVRVAEENLAMARASAFAAIQASPNRLNEEQVRVLTWQAIRPEGGRRMNFGGRRGGPPPVAAGAGGDGFAGLGVSNRGGFGQPAGPEPVRLRDVQLTEIMRLNEVPAVEKLAQEVRNAKRAVVTQIYQDRRDDSVLASRVAAWAAAEARLAAAKSAEFAKFQATSPLKLSADQVATLASWNINAKQGL